MVGLGISEPSTVSVDMVATTLYSVTDSPSSHEKGFNVVLRPFPQAHLLGTPDVGTLDTKPQQKRTLLMVAFVTLC